MRMGTGPRNWGGIWEKHRGGTDKSRMEWLKINKIHIIFTTIFLNKQHCICLDFKNMKQLTFSLILTCLLKSSFIWGSKSRQGHGHGIAGTNHSPWLIIQYSFNMEKLPSSLSISSDRWLPLEGLEGSLIFLGWSQSYRAGVGKLQAHVS